MSDAAYTAQGGPDPHASQWLNLSSSPGDSTDNDAAHDGQGTNCPLPDDAHDLLPHGPLRTERSSFHARSPLPPVHSPLHVMHSIDDLCRYQERQNQHDQSSAEYTRTVLAEHHREQGIPQMQPDFSPRTITPSRVRGLYHLESPHDTVHMDVSSPTTFSERGHPQSHSPSQNSTSYSCSPNSSEQTPASDLTVMPDCFDYPINPFDFRPPGGEVDSAPPNSPASDINIDPSLRPVRGKGARKSRESSGNTSNSRARSEVDVRGSIEERLKENGEDWRVKRKRWGRERKFDEKLFQILTDAKNKRWIHWDKPGKTIVIPDTEAFAENVLPEYYDATQFESFVRQLYSYGFKRRAFEVKGVKGTKIQNDDWYSGMKDIPRREASPRTTLSLPVRRSARNLSQPPPVRDSGFQVSAERSGHDNDRDETRTLRDHILVLERCVDQERGRNGRLQATVQEYLQAYSGSGASSSAQTLNSQEHLLCHLEQGDLPSLLDLGTPGPSISPRSAISPLLSQPTVEAIANLAQLQSSQPRKPTKARKSGK